MNVWRRHVPPVPVVRLVEPSPSPAPVDSSPPEPELPEPWPDLMDHDERDDMTPRKLGQAFRFGQIIGVAHPGILEAYIAGIPLTDTPCEPWTPAQVRALVFYRAAHANGRLRG